MQKKRETQHHSPKEIAKERSNTCTVSHAPLKAPVVVCAMGNLYNKEALIEYLMSKQKFPHFSHISGLKDVSSVTLHWSDAADATPLATEQKSHTIASTDPTNEFPALYTCPISAVPSNGVNRFIAMQPCGCVISERAWKSVGGSKEDALTCIACNKTLTTDTAPIDAQPIDTAAPASSSSSPASPSPFHHPTFVTICPGPEESLYLRGILAERIRAKEAEKARAKAAKKAAAAMAAASSAAATGAVAASSADATADAHSSESHKRKADDQSIPSAPHASKKASSAASSRTGNVLSDSVRAIASAAAASVAAKKKDGTFSSMFLTKDQIANHKYDAMSTKPASCMAML